MPPAVPGDAAPGRSLRLARALLASACAGGLVGLALVAPTPHTTTVTATAVTMRSSIVTDVEVLHEPPAPAPRVVPPPRATRSRPVVRKPRPVRVATARWVRPSSAGVVSPFGMRWGRLHKGIDFGASYGAPIRVIGDGVVVGSGYLGSESGYGLITLVRHRNGIISAYAHQSRSVVHAGERVTAGEVIGYVGSSGHSTGAHLHFEIRTALHGGQINPLPWLREHGVRI